MILEETVNVKFRIVPVHSKTSVHKMSELKPLIRAVWEEEDFGRITHENGTWFIILNSVEWNGSGSGFDVIITAPIAAKTYNRLDEHIERFVKLFETTQNQFIKFKIFLKTVADAER